MIYWLMVIKGSSLIIYLSVINIFKTIVKNNSLFK